MESRVTVLFAVVFALRAIPAEFATSCRYQLFTPSSNYDGYIVSPNYPGHYSPGFCLLWVYFGKPGDHISIRLLDIDIPNQSDTCNNDVLLIGPINEHTYCGSINTKNIELYEAQLTNVQHWLFVAFNSTSFGTKGKGFKLYYQFSNIFKRPVTTSVNTLSTPATVASWSKIYTGVTNCHFVIAAEAGEISSNSTVLSCLERTGKASWLVYTPRPDVAKVNYELLFGQCYLPYPDILTIYDGYTNAEHVLSYVRSPCPSYLMSSHSAVFIEYLRQGTEVLPNFRIQFVMVKTTQAAVTEPPVSRITAAENSKHKFSDKCNTQLSNQSGEINSHDLVSAVHNTGYCSWLLHIPATDGYQVKYKLIFERFQLSKNSIFKVYDGANTSAPTLGVYSSVMPPFNITSSQNSVFLHYIPGINFQSTFVTDIFTVKYNTIVKCALGHEPCGYGEFSCYREDGRCDGIWHCPIHGGDERGCITECAADFSCDFRSSNCYKESDRCNGKGTCSNYMDEMGCNVDRCSSDKGLYLCRNGRCIYEKWRCDRMNDCFDNSDEEDCSILSSPRVIVAGVIGSLLCALLLVIAVGCVCKVYHMRAQQLRGGPHHETPLSRQLAEMFYRRAPPPPYHEAMLTSRPYDEAYLELLGQTEHHLESSGVSSDQNSNPVSPRERSQRSSRQSSRRSRHSQRQQNINQNQHQSSQSRAATARLAEVESLPLLLEEFEDIVQLQGSSSAGPINSTQPPHYNEEDPSVRTESYCSDSDMSSENETWQGAFENTGYAGDDVSVDGQSVIRLESMPPATIRRQSDLTSLSSGLCFRNSNDPERNIDVPHEDDDSDKDAETASTSLSVDSSRMALQEDSNKTQQHMCLIDEDSDSDCILDENVGHDEVDDDDTDSDCILDENNVGGGDVEDDTDSDTACILGDM